MSTRCQIRVEGAKPIFYKHSDGYPSGVLPTLMPLVADFFKHRGFDKKYLLAHICHAFIAEYWKEMEEAAKDPVLGKYHNESGKYLSHGLDTEIHGDIEYLYTVKADGSVVVEGMGWGGKHNAALGTFKLGENANRAIAACEKALKALGR